MGIIKVLADSVKGGLADQWLESVEPPASMGNTVAFAPGVKVRRNDSRNSNVKGSDNTVSDGSLIHVYPNTMMILVDGGKIIAASCEEGYYQVSNTTMPSIFAGNLGGSVKETFNRIKFGGTTPRTQHVYYINLQEMRGITYGTDNPLNYFDSMYSAELFIRAHGTYSMKIVDPLKFFSEFVAKGDMVANNSIDMSNIENKRQLNGEFLTALGDSLGKMSVDGYPIYQIQGKTADLTRYLSDALDDTWKGRRGLVILETTISVSYDEDSKKLVMSRSEGMMFGNQQVQSGYMAKNVAEGIKAAGSNPGGAMNSFIGMGMGMNMGGNIMQGYQQQANQQPQGGYQPQQGGYRPQQGGYAQGAAAGVAAGVAGAAQQPKADTWRCECGAENSGKFCNQCGKPKPAPAAETKAQGWTCECGTVNTGKFCQECGKPKPAKLKCPNCGFEPDDGNKPKFCPECGTKM